MKNRKRTSETKLLLLILMVSTLSFGQNLKVFKAQEIVSDSFNVEPCELISFNVETGDGKSYINWYVKSSSENYYFVLEKSLDGKNYSIIDRRKCFISSLNQKLHYAFIDEKVKASENTYYRIALHKIMAIDMERKLIILSSINIFDMKHNSVAILWQRSEMLAEFAEE